MFKLFMPLNDVFRLPGTSRRLNTATALKLCILATVIWCLSSSDDVHCIPLKVFETFEVGIIGILYWLNLRINKK